MRSVITCCTHCVVGSNVSPDREGAALRSTVQATLASAACICTLLFVVTKMQNACWSSQELLDISWRADINIILASPKQRCFVRAGLSIRRLLHCSSATLSVSLVGKCRTLIVLLENDDGLAAGSA